MPEKKVGEPERPGKTRILEENVEVIKLIDRAGHVKDGSTARHTSSSITHRNCSVCEKTAKRAYPVLDYEVISILNALGLPAEMEISYFCCPMW